MTIPVRTTDISGHRLPPPNQQGGQYTVLQIRPPQFEPPDGAREFLVSYSANVPGAGASTALFTLLNDVIVVPSAAIQLADNTQARISGVSIGGDVPVGVPVLTFSIRDKVGQRFIAGWEGVGLPGRGGIVALGLEPQTWIRDPGTFFGGWVRNDDAGPRYAEMIIQGWMW